MRNLILLIIFAALFANFTQAAPFKFLPHKITQPNGEIIDCYVSGDEFFNWIHDSDGYTIIKAQDGYYYYAINENDKIIPSSFKINEVKPSEVGLKKWVKISKVDYKKRLEKFKVPKLKSAGSSKAPHTGTMNNLVIYIRFLGEAEIETTRETYDNKLNPTTGNSLKSYFQEVSYNNLTISSTHYPACAEPTTTNASYQDTHAREYFQPYNATSNTAGYDGDTERREREHQLLVDAVTWINANHPVDEGLDLDVDNDGNIDNVCFMINDDSDGWSELLWAHRWSLYSQTININGKRVYDYTFQPENQVSVRTLCHEMFHALGAPDLYHYDDGGLNLSPVGTWDIMEYGNGHMCAYMKWKYADAKWVTSIPEIMSSGTYTLNPLTSATDNCFKIASPNSTNEYFVVEYRQKTGEFESNLPGNGLVIYRIKSDEHGNSGFDNSNIFDEIYVYRPNATTTTNGNVDNAHFSSESGRTAINDLTNPSCFLHDGTTGGLDISNVTSASGTISFDVYISSVDPPENLAVNTNSTIELGLGWQLNTANEDVLLVWSTDDTFGAPAKGTSYSLGEELSGGGTVLYKGNNTAYTHTDLVNSTYYYYKIWSVNGSDEYSSGVAVKKATLCLDQEMPVDEGFNGDEVSPCWVTEVVTEGESKEEPASIKQVTLGKYPDANPVEGSHMIQFNSASCGDGNVMRLSSPAFSTVGRSDIEISFSWHRDDTWPDALDSMTVQWSTDGVNWTNGKSYQRYSPVSIWVTEKYTLPVEAEEKENLQVAFLFTSKYGYNCYMDKLKISEKETTLVEGPNQLPGLVFPNPSKGLFELQMNNNYKNISIKVYNLSGKLVYSETQTPLKKYTIDISSNPKGIYVLEVIAGGEKVNYKLVKE